MRRQSCHGEEEEDEGEGEEAGEEGGASPAVSPTFFASISFRVARGSIFAGRIQSNLSSIFITFIQANP